MTNIYDYYEAADQTLQRRNWLAGRNMQRWRTPQPW